MPFPIGRGFPRRYPVDYPARLDVSRQPHGSEARQTPSYLNPIGSSVNPNCFFARVTSSREMKQGMALALEFS
jgi:hypothetical protein